MDFTKVITEMNNGGFYNPITKAIEIDMIGIGIPTYTDINNLAMTHASQFGSTVPAGAVLEQLRVAMTDATNSIYSLVNHTNVLSGVDISGAVNIATIAKTVASAKSLNGEPSCSAVHAAFGSLHKSGEMISETLKSIAIMKDVMTNIPAKILDAISSLTQYTAKIVSQITSDVGSRVAAELEVLKNSVARSVSHLLDDECLKAIAGVIMTPQMRTEIDAVRNRVVQKIIG